MIGRAAIVFEQLHIETVRGVSPFKVIRAVANFMHASREFGARPAQPQDLSPRRDTLLDGGETGPAMFEVDERRPRGRSR